MHYKRHMLPILLLCMTGTARAQTGTSIGSTTAAPSAQLDITATNKGLLIPRMDSANRIGIANPATGLIVYQTNGVKPGFFSYTGTAWRELINSALITDNNTNIGINNTAPAERLDVGGNIAASGGLSIGGTVAAGTNITANGTITANGNISGNGNVTIPATKDYQYATARTAWLSVSPAAFTGIGSSVVSGNSNGSARWVNSGSFGNPAQLFAPVSLPQGANITQLDLFTFDVDPSFDVNAGLVRYNMLTNSVTTIATTGSTSGAVGDAVVSASPTGVIIDNSTYSYYIVFNTYQSSNGLWVKGARVTYTIMRVD